jgi:REP element-mobilizing transposase RayT
MDSDRTFFVTTITAQRLPIFRRETTADLFIETLLHYRDAGKFLLHEFVVMPDHVHLLITPADGDFFGAGGAVHQGRVFASAWAWSGMAGEL